MDKKTIQKDTHQTALYNFHKEQNAKMVTFASYELPISYPEGIIKEHLHTREHASIFDVSHMGQLSLDDNEQNRKIIEKIMPIKFSEMKKGQFQYTMMLYENGGVCDDLMISLQEIPTNVDEYENKIFMVLNAGRIEDDLAYLIENGISEKEAKIDRSKSLIAFQGPQAENVLSHIIPNVEDLTFLESGYYYSDEYSCNLFISRTGYTGEDGFEISLPNEIAYNFANKLNSFDMVKPAGLGSRDSLRLEAGLCLYGNDLNENITPIEASLLFTINKTRRLQNDFLGVEKIMHQLKNGASKRRIGLTLEGRAPVRSGMKVFNDKEEEIGVITSGCFSPNLNKPIAFATVKTEYSKLKMADQLRLFVQRRPGQNIKAHITKLPFVIQKYAHKPKI